MTCPIIRFIDSHSNRHKVTIMKSNIVLVVSLTAFKFNTTGPVKYRSNTPGQATHTESDFLQKTT